MKLFFVIASLLYLSNAAVITVEPGGSIQKAIELAQPGDTVELNPGEYHEDVVTVRDGEIDKRITIQGSRDVILFGTGKEGRMVQIHHSYITLDGFEINGLIGKGDKEEHFVDKGIYAHGNRETRVIKQYGEEFRSAIDGLIISNMKIINFGGECTRFRYFVTNLEIVGSHIENCGVHDFVFNGMKAVNGETVYLGTSSNQIGDKKNPSSEIDQTRFIHIHHNVFKGFSNEVDCKEGVQYALIEFNSCSTQLDPNSGCFDSRSDKNIFRYNKVFGNDGAAVRIGGHDVNGKQWGLENEVYGNVFADNKAGAIKLQTGAKEHPHLCENECKGGCKVSGSASEGNEDIEKACAGVMKIYWVDDTKAAPDAVSPSVDKAADGEPENAADADTKEPEPDFETTVKDKPEPKQSDKCYPVPIENIHASSQQGEHTANMAIDKKFLSRWSAEGEGETLTLEFASKTKIDGVEISFLKGDERTQSFEVAVDGKNILKDQESNGKTLALERFPFPKAVDASSVTIKGGGNSKNKWNSLTELIVCGVEEQKATTSKDDSSKPTDELCSAVEKLKIAKVGASADDGKNKPASVIDGDLKTRWAMEGAEEQDISLELEKPSTVSEIGLAVFEGDKTKQFFDVMVETEEHGWEEVVIDGESVKGKGIESYDLGMKGVKTVKIVCYGMEDIDSGEQIEMNSFTEIELYGC